jgi:hypothetical protein
MINFKKSLKFIIVIVVLTAIGLIIWSNQTPKVRIKGKGGASGGFDKKWLEEEEEEWPFEK